MGRRIARGLGLLLIAAGFLAGLAALALPWARYNVRAGGQVNVDQTTGVSVFSVHLGLWYLLALMVTVVLLAGALAGEQSWRRPCGGLALVAALVAGGLAVMIGGEADSASSGTQALGFATVAVRGSAGTGVWYGIVTPILLGLGATVAGATTVIREPTTAQTRGR
jgi:hypothetical protein